MHRVLVLGAGKIGALVSGLLAEAGDYQVQLADVSGEAAASVARAHDHRTLTAVALDGRDPAALSRELEAHPVDAVISSLRGFVRQEQFRLPAVLANRFGAWFQDGSDKGVSGRMVVEGKAGRQRNLVGVK